MNILHVSPVYYPSVGGHALHMKEISEGLARLGENVTVFTSRAFYEHELRFRDDSFAPLCAEQRLNGVLIRRFDPHYLRHQLMFESLDKVRGAHWVKEHVFGPEVLDSLRLGPNIPQMVDRIVETDCDLVVSLNAFYANTFFCLEAKQRKSFPLIVIPSLLMPSDLSESSSAPVLQRTFKEAQGLLALTDLEKRILVEKGCPEDKVITVGLGAHPEDFANGDGQRFRRRHGLTDQPVALFLGRRCRGKGCLNILEAMKDVWTRVPEARLVLAGFQEEGYQPLEQSLIDSLSPAQRGKVIRIDEFEQQEKADIYAACDVYVMPSEVDSFGLVYIEAWAAKRPVIACRGLAPASFMTEGKDSLLAGFGDIPELARAMTDLLRDRKKARRLGSNGYDKFMEKFTWTVICRKLQAEYGKVIERFHKEHQHHHG